MIKVKGHELGNKQLKDIYNLYCQVLRLYGNAELCIDSRDYGKSKIVYKEVR